MDAVSPFAWDYNRLPEDRDPAILTCSIAIFQWLPKSSGRGLKKVNASRVCGYMLDRQAVYRKAQEVCDRLTAENARADARPKWLQRTYTVPKPAALVIHRTSSDLPGSVVRAVRLEVMKQILLPADFVKGKQGTYIRRRDNQIHLIDFQAARFGHEYTVNLGFHYKFLPPLFASKPIRTAEYNQLDCGLRARIGDFTRASCDVWFQYGVDRERLQRTFEQNARDCLRVFERAAVQFAEPRRLLSKGGCAINARVVRPWMALDGLFAPFLAAYLGRRQAAIREFERLLEWTEGKLATRIRRELRMLRQG